MVCGWFSLVLHKIVDYFSMVKVSTIFSHCAILTTEEILRNLEILHIFEKKQFTFNTYLKKIQIYLFTADTVLFL